MSVAEEVRRVSEFQVRAESVTGALMTFGLSAARQAAAELTAQEILPASFDVAHVLVTPISGKTDR